MSDSDHLLSSYRFDLPEELIARTPLARRSDARLLVLRRGAARPEHRHFRDIVELLQPGDVLVVNDTCVIPARLQGRKLPSGGRVEVLLSRPEPDGSWVALLGASKRPRPGSEIWLGAGDDAPDSSGRGIRATVVEALPDEPGAWRLVFAGDVLDFAQAHGALPLPPYLNRAPDESDRERYQTVYADPAHAGAVAAPTAGLHFDEETLTRLADRGVDLARVTLHVGPGTFLPVRVDDVRTHAMHAEPWVLSERCAAQLNAARARGGRIVAVGTTSLRTLEAACETRPRGAPFVSCRGLTRLFVRPGFEFKAVDALITNFHLPESTLLMLVSALVGRDRILCAYREAVEQRYRFFSYGDASYLERVDAQVQPPPTPEPELHG